MAARWYVAETHPRKELWAIEHLARQGFATFFPRFRKDPARRQRDGAVLSPAFPGYVFVAFDQAMHGWGSINSTRGIKRLVGPTPNRPQPVPQPAMELLQKRCRDGIMVNLIDNLKPGNWVRINTGPLANKIAQIESLDCKGRISVLFEILGSHQVITLDRGDVGPVL